MALVKFVENSPSTDSSSFAHCLKHKPMEKETEGERDSMCVAIFFRVFWHFLTLALGRSNSIFKRYLTTLRVWVVLWPNSRCTLGISLSIISAEFTPRESRW